jgi:HEAT repeat protein
MEDPNPRVREAAVRAAGRLAPAVAPTADLIRCLRDTDDAVAGFAARSLGWLQVVEAREDIEALLTRDNERTRRDAQNALNRLQ